MANLITPEDFLARSKAVHGETYDYRKTRFQQSGRKVTIVCRKHGDFLQVAGTHMQGSGCPDCAKEAKAEQRRRESKPGVLRGTTNGTN